MTKDLGKIKAAHVGYGQYAGNPGPLGLHLDFGGEAWGVGHFISWRDLGEQLPDILAKAKCDNVAELIGKPVEVEF